MFHPHVTRHRPNRHLLPALLTLHPSLIPLPVGRALYRHPLPMHHLRLGPCILEWTADHYECLTDIGLQAHPNKHADQGAKYDLEPLPVQQ